MTVGQRFHADGSTRSSTRDCPAAGSDAAERLESPLGASAAESLAKRTEGIQK